MTATETFLGIIKLPQYAYRWGYTKPQIDLMLSDAPRISYNHKPKKRSKLNPKSTFKTPSKAHLTKAQATYQAKQSTKLPTKEDLGF